MLASQVLTDSINEPRSEIIHDLIDRSAKEMESCGIRCGWAEGYVCFLGGGHDSRAQMIGCRPLSDFLVLFNSASGVGGTFRALPSSVPSFLLFSSVPRDWCGMRAQSGRTDRQKRNWRYERFILFVLLRNTFSLPPYQIQRMRFAYRTPSEEKWNQRLVLCSKNFWKWEKWEWPRTQFFSFLKVSAHKVCGI